MREVHLGRRLDAGVVQWSAGTQQAAIELITRQAADATATFLTGDYLRRSLDDIEQRAGVPVRDVPATIKFVAAQCRFTDEQQATILDHFIGGADRTAGGVLQAVTSVAQVQDDAGRLRDGAPWAAGDDPHVGASELVAGSGRVLASAGARSVRSPGGRATGGDAVDPRGRSRRRRPRRRVRVAPSGRSGRTPGVRVRR
jgi:hypothetical protein